MHFLIGRGQRLDVVRTHATQLELEGAGWLEVTVDAVLFEVVTIAETEVFWILLRFEGCKGYSSNTSLLQFLEEEKKEIRLYDLLAGS